MKRLLLVFLTSFGLCAEVVISTVQPTYPTLDTYAVTDNRYNKGSVWTFMTNVSQLTNTTAAGLPIARREKDGVSKINGVSYMLSDSTLTNWTIVNTTVDSFAELLAITPVSGGGTVNVRGYYTAGDGGGFTAFLTNSITGTNAYGGKVLSALSGWSWQWVINDKLNARSFGVVADGTSDNKLQLQAAIDYGESSGNTTIWLSPSALTYKWSTVTNRFCELLGGYGAGYNGTVVEQVDTGTTNNFIVLHPPAPSAARFFAPTAGPQPSIRNITMIGHSEANLVNPKPITAVTDRLNFSVATGDLPYTGGVLLTNSYPYLGHVFFYSSLNKYCGYSIITNINYGTGLITLMNGQDRYATPTNSGLVLTNTMKVCFSQVVTETSSFSTETFIDGATAGTAGIYITSTDAASVSSKILIENVNIYGFHCGIRSGSTLLARFKSIETKFCTYAGWADANPGNTRDGSIDDVFVFGKYQPNFNANEGGVTESVTYDNPGFRAPAYGFYGQIASGEMKTMAVNFTVNGWYVKNGSSTRASGVLLEGVIGPALWLDGSKFGSANSTMEIADLEFRTLNTNDVPYPTLTSWTNRAAIYYKNSGVGAPNYMIQTANFSRLSSTDTLYDSGINLVSSDSLFVIDSLGMTNGISGAMLAVGSSTPSSIGRYNVNGVTGASFHGNTFQNFGNLSVINSGPGNLFSISRTDVAGLTYAINLGGSTANLTGTGLVGYTMASSGGLTLMDTDATKAAFLRGQSFGGGSTDTSYLETSFDGTDNMGHLGGGSANAYAWTRGSIRAAANATTTTGTEMLRWNTTGFRAATGGVVGNPSADALLRLDSTSQGLLFPRMTTAERDAISTPTDGLVIYNSTTSKLQVRAGAAWVDLH